MAVGKLYERHGKMMTIKEIAAETGLHIESVRRQIKMKGDANLVCKDNENIILPPLMNGKQYSWVELAKMAGVSHETMRNRVLRKGMTVEDAVALGKHRKPPDPPSQDSPSQDPSRCVYSIKEKILQMWDCGERSIEDVERITGYSMAVISMVLPVDEILEQERRDALRKYGYAVR